MSKLITPDSAISEVYENPVGKDILNRVLLQIGLSEKLVDNKLTGRLTLRGLQKLTRGAFSESFLQSLLGLLNAEDAMPEESEECLMTENDLPEDAVSQRILGKTAKEELPWWKSAVIYQIYPRSFCDGNGDGMGDLPGILSKLDYLQELGVDALWLSPVYDSPQDDNGYDIRDYQKIWEQFGTMQDMEELIRAVHIRGMKIIMDLVINHTSDEHRWFQEALHNEDSPYRDYYYFKKGRETNNWTSFFSGSAWKYFEEQDVSVLHLFSSKQMDLNWECEAMREDVFSMIRWWLEKGVDGFRMDVINYISKREGLPWGDELIGKMMGYTGIEHYFYGPRLHEYLREIREKAFAPYNAFAVGETPGIGMEMGKLITADYRKELDLIFNFDILETPGHTRFDNYRYDLNYLKKYYIDWMENYVGHSWMSLFYENHDNPRMVSKINTDPAYREVIADLLALIQLTLKGTPFIYQGQEKGAVNVPFTSIEQLQDIESRNLYEELCETMPSDQAFEKVVSGTRDHARVPMKWSFDRKEKAVFRFYKDLIWFRKEHPVFIEGKIAFTNKKRKNLFTYYRYDKKEKWYIECNLSDAPLYVGKRPENMELVFSNVQLHGTSLQPYEANLYRVNKK